ncbi:hypothetical protein Fcan01_06901 [Folsomia candida]|uniref:Uncharacterized protein n=1 Tax=Folsomia candida TaxID=158441 RepID=A0A226EKB8_FOLCA|nr:hypothetical protein Fcan01_06901 [Folsomia candida]
MFDDINPAIITGLLEERTKKSDNCKISNTASSSTFQKLQTISILELLMIAQDFMLICFAVCGSIMAVALSNKPQFISALLNYDDHSMMFLGLFSIFQIYIIHVSCGGLVYFTNYTTVYMIVASHWMTTLGNEENSSIGKVKIDAVIRGIRNFRKLEVINSHFNHAQTKFAYPMNYAMFFISSVLTLFALLYGSASVYTTSTTILEKFRRTNLRGCARFKIGMIRREFNALKPFGVETGTLPFITKRSVLVVYAVLSNYSASLLIAFPHSYFA